MNSRLDVLTKAVVWEDTTLTFLGRVYYRNTTTNNKTLLTQAATSAITCAVYDGTTLVNSPTVTISTDVLDTISTGSIWTVDSTGFNFIHKIAASVFSGPDKIYRVEYKITLATSLDVGWAVFEVGTTGITTS
jgi:hypothetical protein